MKKFYLALVILASQQAFADTLVCKLSTNNEGFSITENVPQQGQATITWSNDSSVVRFTKRKTVNGPFVTLEKTYFHPYYDVKVSSTNGPRRYEPFFSGILSAEMQQPKEVFCKAVP